VEFCPFAGRAPSAIREKKPIDGLRPTVLAVVVDQFQAVATVL